MTARELPMFPLGTVLLPGGVLPLHVFEPRYRAMVAACLAGDREFGVVLIERGFEVGGGDERTMTGTIARMVQVAQLPDGRYAMITVGTTRIRVIEWLPDDPYPRASVKDWPDVDASPPPDSAPDARVTALQARVRRLAALSLELGDPGADVAPEISADPAAASYQLASSAPLGPADRHRLLCEPGWEGRLALLDRLLDDAEAILQFRLDGGTAPSTSDEP
jgi:Lon protease-like protein